MINWIIDNLATAPKSEVDESIYNGRNARYIEHPAHYKIIDVRDMVDKKGNPARLILRKIEVGIKLIKAKHKVIICCDYGLSRSNAIAVGILVKHLNYSFDEAVRITLKKTGQDLIELGLLNSIRKALGTVDKKPKDKTILITGADGFIGSALCKLLKGKYHLITPKKSEIDLMKGPIELDLLVKKSNPSLIIHLANPKIYTTNKAMSEMILMLKNVLDVCRENKISIIFPSSWVIFSGHKNRLIYAQSSFSPNPGDTYSQAKFLCEALLNQYKENYGVKIAIIRFSPIYGLESNRPKFIFDFIEKAKKNHSIYTHNYKNGPPVLDLLNIKDAVSAIELVLKKNFFGVINIGSGKGVSTLEIAQKIKKLCCSKSKIFVQEMDDYAPKIVMDAKEAKKFLGWSPKITLDKGIKKIIKYFYEPS